MSFIHKRSVRFSFAVAIPIVLVAARVSRDFKQQNLNHELASAVIRRDARTASELLKRGANPNAKYDPALPASLGETITTLFARFSRASRQGPGQYRPTITCLTFWPKFESGAVGFGGYTFQTRKVQDDPSLVAALLDFGGDPSSPDEHGETLLYRACYCDNLRTVRLLVSRGVNVNAQDVDGFTPLMVASTPIARFLIEHGARVSIRDTAGLTALDNARSFGAKADIHLLEAAFRKEHRTPQLSY